MGDLRWQREGNCAGSANDTHFPQERLRSEEDRLNTREAKRLCATCPQRERCLAYALEENINYGIWGGLTSRERKRLRRDRAKGLLSAAS